SELNLQLESVDEIVPVYIDHPLGCRARQVGRWVRSKNSDTTWIAVASGPSAASILTVRLRFADDAVDGTENLSLFREAKSPTKFMPSEGNRGVEGNGQVCVGSPPIFQGCPAAVPPRPPVLRSYISASSMPLAGLGRLLQACRVSFFR